MGARSMRLRCSSLHGPAPWVASRRIRAYHPGMKPSRAVQAYEGQDVTVTFGRSRSHERTGLGRCESGWTTPA